MDSTKPKASKKNPLIGERPKKGQIMTVYGAPARITRVYPFGTVDVVRLDGSRAFRVTGLNFF